MAAFALSDQGAACGAQQFPQRAVELRRHSCSREFGFAKRGNLEKQGSRINVWMIVGQEIQRHGGHPGQQSVKRWRIGSGWNVVAMAGPYRGFGVPRG
jgi:hypothetical protein